MANLVKTAQELADLAVKYNDACIEYNEFKGTDEARAALAGLRAVEALADYTGVRLVVSGDTGVMLREYSKLLPHAPNSNNPNAPFNIDDPLVYKEWGMQPPPKDNKGGTCSPIGLPTKSWWERAKDFILRRDPLTFDLARVGRNSLRIAP